MLETAPTLLATLGLGFALGLAHALDADHLVAVSTLVSERPSPRRSALVGLAWGLGHAGTLAAVGAVAVAAGRTIPPGVGAWLEGAVALMLVVLGAQAVRRGLAPTLVHAHTHAHDGRPHVHHHLHVAGLGRHEGLLHGLAHVGRRPLVVGMVHGLAGSAVLTLVVLAAIPEPALALAYVVVFGLGSIGGMVAVSAILALPLAAAASLGQLQRRLQVMLGAGGVAFGLVLALRLCAAHGG